MSPPRKPREPLFKAWASSSDEPDKRYEGTGKTKAKAEAAARKEMKRRRKKAATNTTTEVAQVRGPQAKP